MIILEVRNRFKGLDLKDSYTQSLAHTHTQLWHYIACRKGHFFFPNSLSRNKKTECSLVGLQTGLCSACKSDCLLLWNVSFPAGSVVKNPVNAGSIGDEGWIPGLGRSPGGGNGNPL